MDYKFCCYGTYNKYNFRCLIKCPDKEQCEFETGVEKWKKYHQPKEEEQDGEDN